MGRFVINFHVLDKNQSQKVKKWQSITPCHYQIRDSPDLS